MKLSALPLALVACVPLLGDALCPPTPAYWPCDLVFEMTEAEAREHPNPYLSVRLEAELRSPRYRTMLMPGFWDGGRRMVVRFAPTGPGTWDFRLRSSLKSLDGRTGQVEAIPSDSPGFLRPRNLHHWGYTETDDPHLWMGDTSYRFAFIEQDVFDKLLETRAAQKFNHLRGLAIGGEQDSSQAFPTPNEVNIEYFRRLDARILAINRKGIITDLILGGGRNHLANLFPSREQRERYIRYMVARYSAMHITWQGVHGFEEYDNGRELLREIGGLLKELDPYGHPRSTHTLASSAPLFSDGWMNYILYQSSDNQLGAIEHMLYPAPMVNAGFAYGDSGAGRSQAHHVDTDTFRRRLWNTTMNGQYPVFGNTGTYAGRKLDLDPQHLDSPGARQMSVWFDFFSGTRFWELEPYFDVDGGRAVALEGVEYIVYVEKPQPVQILLQRHRYDVAWVNPITGERIRGRRFRENRYNAEPPNQEHDWVLHISREGTKDSMLRRYKFESRPVLLQVVEQNPSRTPFEIAEPEGDVLSAGVPVQFKARVTRETRATSSMMWLWTGEVVGGGQGYRVLGTGPEGELQIPPGIARSYPAVLNLRLAGLNANGKVYLLDKVYRLTK